MRKRKWGSRVSERSRDALTSASHRRSKGKPLSLSLCLSLFLLFPFCFFLSDNRSALLARPKSKSHGHPVLYNSKMTFKEWDDIISMHGQDSVFYMMWFSGASNLFLFSYLPTKTARYSAGWMKMKIIVRSPGTTSLPCFSLWVFLITDSWFTDALLLV